MNTNKKGKFFGERKYMLSRSLTIKLYKIEFLFVLRTARIKVSKFICCILFSKLIFNYKSTYESKLKGGNFVYFDNNLLIFCSICV